jgi:hypothetical protein
MGLLTRPSHRAREDPRLNLLGTGQETHPTGNHWIRSGAASGSTIGPAGCGPALSLGVVRCVRRYHQLCCSGGGAVPLVCCTTGGSTRGAGAFSVIDGGNGAVVLGVREKSRGQLLDCVAGGVVPFVC